MRRGTHPARALTAVLGRVARARPEGVDEALPARVARRPSCALPRNDDDPPSFSYRHALTCHCCGGPLVRLVEATLPPTLDESLQPQGELRTLFDALQLDVVFQPADCALDVAVTLYDGGDNAPTARQRLARRTGWRPRQEPGQSSDGWSG